MLVCVCMRILVFVWEPGFACLFLIFCTCARNFVYTGFWVCLFEFKYVFCCVIVSVHICMVPVNACCCVYVVLYVYVGLFVCVGLIIFECVCLFLCVHLWHFIYLFCLSARACVLNWLVMPFCVRHCVRFSAGEFGCIGDLLRGFIWFCVCEHAFVRICLRLCECVSVFLILLMCESLFSCVISAVEIYVYAHAWI